MLTYSFQDIGNTPLYEHLYKCIKNDIVNGTLTAGMKLPSKRSFAANLGVSAITVENAYASCSLKGTFTLSRKRATMSLTFPEAFWRRLPSGKRTRLPKKSRLYITQTFPATRPAPKTFRSLSGQNYAGDHAG